tara:strand:- start:199 stop:381 length:183 start_codon:yes stop_codon:yes gene_type:complete
MKVGDLVKYRTNADYFGPEVYGIITHYKEKPHTLTILWSLDGGFFTQRRQKSDRIEVVSE